MNFTYHLSKSPDGQWGATQPDGSWSGMVKELQEQRSDMGKFQISKVSWISIKRKSSFDYCFKAITDFTITMERSAVMTFAQPIVIYYHSLFIKNPTGTFNYMAYIEPLHYMAWVGIALFVLLTPPFMHCTAS